MRVFGADEAGRGPVLGPMVAAAVLADPEALPRDVADSKTLTAAKREALAATMRNDSRIGVGVSVVSPERIDDSTTDMNTLTVVAQADAIAGVLDPDPDPSPALGPDSDSDGGVETAVDEQDSGEATRPRGVVDACDVYPERFARRIRDALGGSVDLRAEHRADASHAIVAAASVVAKVERDALMADLADQHQEYGPVGSGYPSDRRTRDFLREYVRANDALPACARASWKTSRDVLDAASQSALGDF